jgi:hypothetical protein
VRYRFSPLGVRRSVSWPGHRRPKPDQNSPGLSASKLPHSLTLAYLPRGLGPKDWAGKPASASKGGLRVCRLDVCFIVQTKLTGEITIMSKIVTMHVIQKIS